MKTRLISIAAAAALASSVSAFAVNSDQNTKDLSARTNALENQVHLLKAQINQMLTKNKKAPASQNKDQGKTQDPWQAATDGTEMLSKEEKLDILLAQAAHRPFIVSSPVFGMRRPDDSFSNLMNKLSSMNEDLLLLRLRQKMDNYAVANNIPFATRPVISLSGGLEGEVNYRSNDKFTTAAKSTINLSKAELDVIAEVGSWATGAMIIDYDDDAADYTNDVSKISNSRLRVNRAWVTLGKLNKTPFYFTLGQVYAPFGTYSSNMITTPATRTLGRTKDRMIVLGYANPNGLYAQIFGTDGETKPDNNVFFKHTGANIGHRFETENFALNIGGGILGNLAESQGMQSKIFAKSTDAERIHSSVCGLDAYAKATFFKTYNLMAEYVSASSKFNQQDFMFNGEGAKPSAYSIEGSMNFKTLSKPSSVFAAFGGSTQMLALGAPKQSYAVGYAISPTKYALTTVEYRHDINYAYTDSTKTIAKPNIGDKSNKVQKRHNNRVTLSLGLYF